MNNLYMLTHLTGQTSQTERTAVIGFVEMRRRVLIIMVLSGAPALISMLFLLPLFGAWALLAIPTVIGVALWIFESRSRSGLQLRTWQHLTDKHLNSKSGDVFHQCGRPISVADHWMRVIPASVPVRAFDPDAVDEFADFSLPAALGR